MPHTHNVIHLHREIGGEFPFNVCHIFLWAPWVLILILVIYPVARDLNSGALLLRTPTHKHLRDLIQLQGVFVDQFVR